VQKQLADFGKLKSMVSLVAFEPFKSSEDALANANAVSEGMHARNVAKCHTGLAR
jgi:hypothetical protein